MHQAEITPLREQELTPWRRWTALAVLVLPVLLISVDMTVLGFAVPALSEDLRPSGSQLLWIVDIYSFLLAGLLVLMGNLGDRIGRRRLLMIGAVTFGAASALAAFSTSTEMLILARALLGIGGATLMPSTLALIRTVFADDDERRRAIAIWAASFAGGAAVGPTIGGFLLEHFWWGSVFLINTPIMVLLLLGCWFLLPESRNPAPGAFDLPSAALSIVGMLTLVYGLKTLGKEGVTVAGLGAVLLGAAVLWWFVGRQRRLVEPLLDLDLFRHRRFAVAVLTNLLSVFALLGLMFFLPQYLQLVLGKPPLTAALWMLPMAGATIAGALLAPRLARRLPLNLLIGGGMLLAASGFAVGLLLTASGPLWIVVAAGVLVGAGIGLAETMTNDVIIATAPAERAGAAAAISETAYEFGAAMGIAVLGTVGLAAYRSGLTAAPAGVPQESIDAAGETLGAAVEVARHLDPTTASAFLDVVGDAFTTGMLTAFAVAAAVATYNGIQALVTLRGTRGQDTSPQQDGPCEKLAA